MSAGLTFSGITPNSLIDSKSFNSSYVTDPSNKSDISSKILGSLSSGIDTGPFSFQKTNTRIASLNTLYNEATGALNKINKLSADNPDSVFYQKISSSSNTDVADISYFHSRDYSYGTSVTGNPRYPDLTQVVLNKINLGKSLNPDSASVIDIGLNRFNLSTGPATHQLSFEVNFGDTNKNVLNKMAASINNADAGVTAGVVEAPSDTIYLRLSNDSGTTKPFYLKDTSGNAVRSTHEFDNSGSESSYEFDISQTASEQINKGGFLNPAGITDVSAGTNRFELTVGSNSHTISFDINSGDTNDTVLDKMAAAINDVDTGVFASVADVSDDVIYLRLSGQTGTSNAFTLTDISGNAVSATNANSPFQYVKNSSFSVNETSFDRESNTIALKDGKMAVTLKDTGKANITVSHDTNTRVNTITSLADSINSINTFLESNSDISSDLRSEWQQLVSDATSSLAQYGIEVASDMQLNLDKEKLNRQLNENIIPVRDAIGGKNGMVQKLKPFLRKILSSPGINLLESQPPAYFDTMYLRLISSKTTPGGNQSTFSTVA